MRKNWLVKYSCSYLFLMLTTVFAYDTCAGQIGEFIRDGGFELGIVEVDIVRFPRYTIEGNSVLNPPARDREKPLSGNFSLRLPGLPTGGYRLVSRTVPLLTDKRYQLSLEVRVADKQASIRLEVFTVWNRVAEKQVNLKTGDHHINLSFDATGGTRINTDETPFFIRIWVNGRDTVWLDNLSLRGPSGSSGVIPQLYAWLEPDRNMAVYAINGEGNFTVKADACNTCKISYRIVNPIRNLTVATGNLISTQLDNDLISQIPLILSKRGFFWVEIQVHDKQGKEVAQARHSYVVINPEHAQTVDNTRFGIAMEEYGPTSQIDAFVSPAEYYKLAHQIGVGSVRVFSLLMPDMVSHDGKYFNFSEADTAISLMNQYGIEPMIVLGSNNIHRIPHWLRGAEPSNNSIDLLKGLRVPSEQKRFKRSQISKRYLYLDKYKIYLEAVFKHLKGKVKYYELWNEPGHKFLTEDILRIAKLTRDVQQRIDPDSYILGYSSTRRGKIGAGEEPSIMPEFIQEVLLADGIKHIDILSYHSGHAFLFMSKNPDRRNHETEFVPRLEELLNRADKVDLTIWDSERGIPWRSPHKERIDFKAGTKRWTHSGSSVSVLDVARQLPMVYAAAYANNVERLFWFYLESSAGLIQRADMRWGFFDAQREPMPLLPVYDAMTEIISDAEFIKSLDKPDGTRVYEFKRDDTTVLLAYNWKRDNTEISIDHQGVDIEVQDIVGEMIEFIDGDAKGQKISVNEWPQYILIRNVSNGTFTIH